MSSDDPMERVKARLSGVRGSAARCPAHDDQHQSLSVNRGAGGKVLLKCHAGCELEAVLAAIGLEKRDLFAPGSKNGDRPQTARRWDEIMATYDYVDEDGRPLHQTIRLHPKGFKQRHFNGSEWKWGLGGTRLVLYRLPELIEAVALEKLIHVCEGEKDVLAVEAAGGVATCNPMGAGPGKWRPEFAEQLREARVRIVADNDEEGIAHARRVAASLDGVAASVDIVRAAEGKDAADHLAAGHGLGDFIPLGEGPDEEWPDEPDLPGAPGPDPLPLDALPPGLAQYVRTVADATQTSPDMAVMLALAAVSAVLGGRVEVRVDDRGWREVVTLYTVVVLPPGARKSPVFAEITRPIYAWQAAEAERLQPARQRAEDSAKIAEAAHNAARLAAAKGEAELDEVDYLRAEAERLRAAVPVPLRIIVDDVTPEKLAGIMAEHGGAIALLAPEADPLGIADGRYSPTARPGELLRAWSGEPIVVDRISRNRIHIARAVLTLGLTIQPAALAALRHGNVLRGRGLFGRILWVTPPHGFGTRLTGADVPPLDLDACRSWGELLKGLFDARERYYRGFCGFSENKPPAIEPVGTQGVTDSAGFAGGFTTLGLRRC
jgi:putative DNA primase/helicase